MLYFRFWPSIVVILLTQVVSLIEIGIYHDDIDRFIVAQSILGTIWLFVNLLAVHIGTNAIGLLFVETEILRDGN